MTILASILEIEGKTFRHLRKFEFDLDDGKSFCYRSRVSSNAFFHSLKQRNWKGGKTMRNCAFLYTFGTVEEREITDKIMRENGVVNPPPVRVVRVKNLWEFYKMIGWDYKTKKWVQA